jgi:hypothetical protein
MFLNTLCFFARVIISSHPNSFRRARTLADEVVEQIVETLQDFFGDYSQWLASDFHMGRVIKDVCHHLVTRYITQLIEKKPMAKRSTFRCAALRIPQIRVQGLRMQN